LNKNSLKRKRFKENRQKEKDSKIHCDMHKLKFKNSTIQKEEETKPNQSVGLKGFSHERMMRISKSNTKKNGD
jgi:hypothetical protein